MPGKAPSFSRNTWIAVGGFGTLLVAFLIFGFAPYWLATSRLNHEIQDFKAQMDQEAAQSQQLRDLSAKATHLSRETYNFPRLVSANADLGRFLGQLDQVLESAGMRDTSKRALPPTVLGKCSQLPIEVHGSGSFEQVNDFLQRLEGLKRMSSVSKLEVKADEAMSGRVTVDVTLSIYNSRDN